MNIAGAQLIKSLEAGLLILHTNQLNSDKCDVARITDANQFCDFHSHSLSTFRKFHDADAWVLHNFEANNLRISASMQQQRMRS